MNGWYSVWEVQPFARALHSTNASPKTVPQGRFTDQPVRRLHFNYITHVGDKTLKLILRKFIGIGSPCSAARQLPWDPTAPWGGAAESHMLYHVCPWMPMDDHVGCHGRPRATAWDAAGAHGRPWDLPWAPTEMLNNVNNWSIRGVFQGGRVLQGLVWVGDWSTFYQ